MTEQGRLTREEQRARTRAELLDAAARVFARDGYHTTTVDQVAEAAGYTKGAVYSNFDSKEALFLALFDRHLAQAVDLLVEVLEHGDPAERAALVGQQRDQMTVYDRDWFLLETEFLLYAARNNEVRERLASRQREARRRIAKLVQQHLDDLGAAVTVDTEDLAAVMTAAADGLTAAMLTQPEIEPGRLLTLLLALLERGATR